MTQKNLSTWLKGILLGIAVCGTILCGLLIPLFGKDLIEQNPEFSHWYVPWLAVLWIAAIPCYLVLYNSWKITAKISRDQSFCMETAVYLKRICILSLMDSGYFFIANMTLLFLLNMSHPGVMLASLVVDFAGVAVAGVAAVLSHLVQKATELQQQQELTI